MPDFVRPLQRTAGAPLPQGLGPTDSPTFTAITLSDLTALRLTATDAAKKIISVAALSAWIAGTANQVVVADDGDGSITLSTPQDITAASSPTFAGVTLSSLTASRLMASSGAKAAISVANLQSWIAGTANQIITADDGDGSITLSTPQSIGTGSSPIFAGLTNSALTSGRVVISGASGIQTDDADLTFTGGNTLHAHTLTVDIGALTVTDGTVTTGNATAMSLSTSGGIQFKALHLASAVNYIYARGAITGNPAYGIIGITGADSNMGINYNTAGTGRHRFSTDGDGTTVQVEIISIASANRFITLAGSNNGNPTIATSGGQLAITPDMLKPSGSNIQFNNPDNTISMTIKNAGATGANNFIISGAAIRFGGYGAGALTTDGSGNITAASDPATKSNIRPFMRGLESILEINPILHGYTKESGLDQTRLDYVGFDAINVYRTIPEAVGKNPDLMDTEGNIKQLGYLTFNPFVVLAASVNALKELDKRLKAGGL